MYVKLSNNEPDRFPYSVADLRSENPGTSFPAEVSDNLLAEFNVYPVVATAVPNFDRNTHRPVQSVSLVNDVWTQAWTLLQLPEQTAATNIRADRDRLLLDSDWTQTKDAPGDTAAWATYRQALRDITAQEGFPFTVTWPTEPS